MNEILFENCTIVNSESPFLIKKGWLKIVNDKIIGFGKGSTQLKSIRKIDLKNKIIIPGFINCHTHAAMVAFRGFADDLPLKEWLEKYIWPKEKKELSPKFVQKWSNLAFKEMLASGITTCVDMYFYSEDAANEAKNIGIRFIGGEVVLDFVPNGLKKNEFILKKEIPGLWDFFIMPHSTYSVSRENLLKAKKLAIDYKKKLLIHAAETKTARSDIINLEKLGILDQDTILVHSVWLDKKDIKVVFKRNSKIVHCPQSNMKLASGISPVAEMIKQGIIIGLGTDGAASNNNLDMFREMKTASLLSKVSTLDPTVLPAKKVFQMATIDGARVLGKEKEIGSIKVGKKADLVILDFNKVNTTPLSDYYSQIVYAANPQNVVATIVNGYLTYGRLS